MKFYTQLSASHVCFHTLLRYACVFFLNRFRFHAVLLFPLARIQKEKSTRTRICEKYFLKSVHKAFHVHLQMNETPSNRNISNLSEWDAYPEVIQTLIFLPTLKNSIEMNKQKKNCISPFPSLLCRWESLEIEFLQNPEKERKKERESGEIWIPEADGKRWRVREREKWRKKYRDRVTMVWESKRLFQKRMS